MGKIADLFVAVGADITKFRAGMDDARKHLDDLEGKASNAVKGFDKLSAGMLAAGGAIAVGLGSSVKTAMEFEAQMSKVGALSHATGKDFADLRKAAIDLGASSVFSASEAAEGMQNLSAAGFNTKQVLAAMPGVLDAAAASGESFANVSDIMITAMNGFGLQAKDMGHIADVLAGAANDSSISVAQIGLSAKYVAPVMSKAGQSVETMGAALAELGNAGIKADMAGTALRMGFTRLADPPKEAAGAIHQLGLKVTDAHGKFLPMSNILDQLHDKYKNLSQAQQLQKTSTIFGTEAMSAWMTLIDKGGAALEGLAGKYRTMTGVAHETARIMTDNLKGAWSSFTGAMESASISIGSALIPALRALTEAATGFVNRFNALPDSMKSFLAIGAAVTSGVLLIGGALAGLVALVPSFIAGWGAIATAVGAITGPVALAVAGVVAAGVIIVKFYRDNEQVRDAITSCWNSIKDAARDVWPWISEIVKATAATIMDIWRLASPVIAAVVVAAFQTIGNVVTTAMGIIKGVIQTGLAVVEGLWKTGAAILRGDWAGAWQAIKDMMVNVWTGIKATFSAAVTGIINQAKILGTAVLSSISGLVKGVQEWMGAKLQAALAPTNKMIETVKGWFFGLYDAVVGHSYIPDMVKETGKHMETLDKHLVHPAKKHTSEAAKAFKKLQHDVAEIMAGLSSKIQEAAIEFRVTGDRSGLFRDQMNAAAEALKSGFRTGLAETNPLMLQAQALYKAAATGLQDLERKTRAQAVANQALTESLAAAAKPNQDYVQALDALASSVESTMLQQDLWGRTMEVVKSEIKDTETAINLFAKQHGAASETVRLLKEELARLKGELKTLEDPLKIQKEQYQRNADAVRFWGDQVKALSGPLAGIAGHLGMMNPRLQEAATFATNAAESVAKMYAAMAGGDEKLANQGGIAGLIANMAQGLKMIEQFGSEFEQMVGRLMGHIAEVALKPLVKAGNSIQQFSGSIGNLLSKNLSLNEFATEFSSQMRKVMEAAFAEQIMSKFVNDALMAPMAKFHEAMLKGNKALLAEATAELKSAAATAVAGAKQAADAIRPILDGVVSETGALGAKTGIAGFSGSTTRDLKSSGAYFNVGAANYAQAVANSTPTSSAYLNAGAASYAESLARANAAQQPQTVLDPIWLADGGVAMGPTLAMIGEEGPEAVVPLDRWGGGGQQININITGNHIMSDRDMELFGQKLIRAVTGRGGIQLAGT